MKGLLFPVTLFLLFSTAWCLEDKNSIRDCIDNDWYAEFDRPQTTYSTYLKFVPNYNNTFDTHLMRYLGGDINSHLSKIEPTSVECYRYENRWNCHTHDLRPEIEISHAYIVCQRYYGKRIGHRHNRTINHLEHQFDYHTNPTRRCMF